MYNKFGFRGPFILGIIITVVDLIGRLLIIERENAILHGIDPAAAVGLTDVPQTTPVNDDCEEHKENPEVPAATTEDDTRNVTVTPAEDSTIIAALPPLSLLGVVWKLLRSSRALTVLLSTLMYGCVSGHIYLVLLTGLTVHSGWCTVPKNQQFHCACKLYGTWTRPRSDLYISLR